MLLPTYRSLSTLLAPLIRHLLRRRLRAGKEDAERLGERMGVAGRPRPPGPLVWVHAASVGEALSALPLIARLRARRNPPDVLVTTGTVTSAEMMAARLPKGAYHQFVPVDCLPWVERFLDYWRPDLALWLESELWPNLIACTASRGVPLLLVNGRISERSFRNWRRLPATIATLMGCFDLVMAQNQTYAGRFRTLGARRIETPGNLKYAAEPLPFDAKALEDLQLRFDADPMWLAASTHPGEEEMVAQAHKAIAAKFPGLVTIIAPRHPHRGAEITERMLQMGLVAVRRSAETVGMVDKPDVYVADTLGELGLFYRLAQVAFIGGSLVPKGGQNPIEPARLDCAIVSGPHVENFPDVYADLAKARAAVTVTSVEELAAAVSDLLATSDRREAMIRAARTVAEEQGAVISRVLEQIEPYLIAFVGGGKHARA